MKRFFRKIWRAIRPHLAIVGIVLLIAFLLVSAVCATVYTVERTRMERENARRTELAKPYELERLRIERELMYFDSKLKDSLTGGSTLTIMIHGADVAIYENIWPIFVEMNASLGIVTPGYEDLLPPVAEAEEEQPVISAELLEARRLTATVCFAPEDMPGMEGMITLEQYAELYANGWTSAVYVAQENTDDLGAYLSEMRARYDELGIEWTDTLYFERTVYGNAYDPVYDTNPFDEVLHAHGITTVIDMVDEGEDILSQNAERDIWCVKADGWSLAPSKGSAVDNYNKLLEYKGAMVFVVEMWEASREGPTHFIPDFSDEAFKRMIVKFCESVAEDKLAIAAASTAKKNYVSYNTEYLLRRDVYEPARKALRARLAEVIDILDKIYAGEYVG